MKGLCDKHEKEIMILVAERCKQPIRSKVECLRFLATIIDRARIWRWSRTILNMCATVGTFSIQPYGNRRDYNRKIIQHICEYYGLITIMDKDWPWKRCCEPRYDPWGVKRCCHFHFQHPDRNYKGGTWRMAIHQVNPPTGINLEAMFPKLKYVRKWQATQKWYNNALQPIRDSLMMFLFVCKLYYIPRDIRHVMCSYIY